MSNKIMTIETRFKKKNVNENACNSENIDFTPQDYLNQLKQCVQAREKEPNALQE